MAAGINPFDKIDSGTYDFLNTPGESMLGEKDDGRQFLRALLHTPAEFGLENVASNKVFAVPKADNFESMHSRSRVSFLNAHPVTHCKRLAASMCAG